MDGILDGNSDAKQVMQMRLSVIPLLFAAVLLPLRAHAQVGSTTDILMGRVTGPEGAAVSGARAESFFSTIEFELLIKNDWHTREEARRGIFRYIETWYNRRRPHSTFGYISPAEYEQQLKEAA